MATSTTKKTATKSTAAAKKTATKSTATKSTATKSTATKSTGTKSTAAKKITPAKTETKASGSGFNLSGLLTGAVTSAITSKISSGAIGFKDVNGDGKVDLKDIIQTIVSSFQDGKINVSSISSAITQVWNAGFKSGQESK